MQRYINWSLQQKDLPLALSLGLPLAVLFLIYLLAALGYSPWLRSESGIIEILTNIFLVLAVFYFLSIVWHLSAGISRWWFVLMLVGTFYFAGEEMSWGQFIFGWETPETWKTMNDQGETNLHNTWSFLDQPFRIALTLAALVGGIIVPLYRYFSGAQIPSITEFWGLFPTLTCTATCTSAIIVSPLDDWLELSSLPLLQHIGQIPGGEFKECLLALFILLYAMSARRRIQEHSTTTLR